MAIRDIFKVNRKTFLYPSGWMDLNGLIRFNQTLRNIVAPLFARQKAEVSESFEEAMRRQGLTEKDIADGISTYRAYAVIFLILTISSILYAGLLIVRHQSFTGFMLAIAVTGLFASQAFKYDFWALQMRRRQLGLTFADWKRQYFG